MEPVSTPTTGSVHRPPLPSHVGLDEAAAGARADGIPGAGAIPSTEGLLPSDEASEATLGPSRGVLVTVNAVPHDPTPEVSTVLDRCHATTAVPRPRPSLLQTPPPAVDAGNAASLLPVGAQMLVILVPLLHVDT